MDEKVREFLEANRAAAMITLRPDGTPHAARVAIGFLDGRLLSSGTQSRLRTRYLRRDPRCTLFVIPTQGSGYLVLDTRVSMIEGPEVPGMSLRFFQDMQRSLNPPPKPGTVTWYG